ncbi:hypothetical protein [Rhodoferax sp.]|uniref:hypothetical protein n=1 Tax=Rhodoferax sp. TaxID=50421 RepID=UPI0025F5CD93|nr:hypothetical protein [Rhodoferax sp.]
MDSIWSNFITELIGRVDGPMHFRIYLQPLVAIFFAFRDGRKDAREGRPAYGWALLTNSEHRRYLLQDGWKGFRNVFLIALLLDLVYQYVAIGGFRPLQTLLTALLLAVVPYLLLRGPVNRLSGGGK